MLAVARNSNTRSLHQQSWSSISNILFVYNKYPTAQDMCCSACYMRLQIQCLSNRMNSWYSLNKWRGHSLSCDTDNGCLEEKVLILRHESLESFPAGVQGIIAFVRDAGNAMLSDHYTILDSWRLMIRKLSKRNA